MTEGFFESFYQSPIQHPVLLWISNLVGTAFALRLLPAAGEPSAGAHRRFLLLWAFISGLDAWLSANQVLGLGVLANPWSLILPFLFVWLGDFRVFLAMERLGAEGAPLRLGRAIGACFLVPLLAGLLTRGQEARVLFLVYESLFFLWILVYGRWTGLARNEGSRQIRNLSLVFYSLWILADVLILFSSGEGKDLGFAVRVIPNLIYYGWFGWVYARAAS